MAKPQAHRKYSSPRVTRTVWRLWGLTGAPQRGPRAAHRATPGPSTGPPLPLTGAGAPPPASLRTAVVVALEQLELTPHGRQEHRPDVTQTPLHHQ